MYGFIQRGNSRTEYYEEVKLSVSKTGKCYCGKKLSRKTTLMQTLNPFNKNKETGELKTRSEIIAELKIDAEEWKKKPCRHSGMEWSDMPREEYRKVLSREKGTEYDWPMICGFRRESGEQHNYKKI